MDILPGTKFIDRFVRGIFPPKRKVIPWNLQPVAIVAYKLQITEVNVVDSGTKEVNEAEQVLEDAVENFVVRVKRQVVLQPNTKHHVLVTTKSRGLLTIEPRILRSNR